MATEVVTVYRVGNEYTLETADPDAEPVSIALAEGIYLARSGRGELLLYREHHPYGARVAAALAQGWCRLQEEMSVVAEENREG
jgi:hypothetical protein